MGQALKRVLFGEQYRLSPGVQTFDCGPERWQAEIAEWLKSPTGAVAALTHPTRRTDVWLYLTEDGQLVGYSSLGSTRWHLNEPYNKPVTLNIIPYMGLDVDFQGAPKGALPHDRYSTLIMEDLIAEAEEACRRFKREPFLALYVHPDNIQAKRFYARMRFEPFDRVHDGYESMLRELLP
jgi:GNAT superfamily N-acetyltransferase